jgi:hypothetical protein
MFDADRSLHCPPQPFQLGFSETKHRVCNRTPSLSSKNEGASIPESTKSHVLILSHTHIGMLVKIQWVRVLKSKWETRTIHGRVKVTYLWQCTKGHYWSGKFKWKPMKHKKCTSNLYEAKIDSPSHTGSYAWASEEIDLTGMVSEPFQPIVLR